LVYLIRNIEKAVKEMGFPSPAQRVKEGILP
jgi:hypothetical protein